MSESKQNALEMSELEMSELPQASPNEFTKDVSAPLETDRSPWICNLKKWMLHILLVVASIALVVFISSADAEHPAFDTSSVESGNFPFLVHCPYSYKSKVRPVSLEDEKNGDLRRRRLYSSYSYNLELKYPQKHPEYDWSNTYVVDMQSRKNETTGDIRFYYCGIVTNIGSSCDDEVFEACSIPGPMFDLKTKQHVDIIWINNLNKDIFMPNICMGITDPSKQCHLKFKSTANNTETFLDPIKTDGGDIMRITPSTWPATVHVHGAEVRPTFDGNPLSWISNNGQRGIGTFSLSDKCYYDAFDQHTTDKNSVNPPEVLIKRVENDEEISALPQAKINRYLNIQSPGTLFYHDHSMNMTRYNVQFGLSGVYILRDPKVEKEIGVNSKNEKLVMLTRDGLKHTENLESATDVVYRFRFVNNKYHRHAAYNFSFVYGNNCENQTSNIPFTIIGTDSSLFHEGLQNQTSFTLAQGERVELLVKFEPKQKQYSVCRILSIPIMENKDILNSNLNILGIKLFHRSQYKYGDLNQRKHINNVKLSVPFTDLKGDDHPIVVRRMKSITYVVYDDALSLNGRYNFHQGRSDYPTIGTTEDWYFINCLRLFHPIHVHLINFQVKKVLSLRRLTPDSLCVIYELDIVASSMQLPESIYKIDRKIFPNASDPRNVNYTYLCSIMTVLMNDPDFVPLLTHVQLEDVIQNGVTGIDVEKKLDDYDRELFEKLNISTAGGDGKYVTDQVNPIKPYYKGWKDVGMVDAFKVFVFRIRWTKNSYKGGDDTYFNVPLDQLREYPGFIYHCHVLNHEDSGMMRPYMLQLPKDAKLNPETPCNNVSDYSWAAKVKCINQRCLPK